MDLPFHLAVETTVPNPNYDEEKEQFRNKYGLGPGWQVAEPSKTIQQRVLDIHLTAEEFNAVCGAVLAALEDRSLLREK